ncbi:MAG: hypothetical protein GQ468_02785 [Candidatus Scalindua sp.]|nr:hypothetical protein [Candidatus Scalindua sp.]
MAGLGLDNMAWQARRVMAGIGMVRLGMAGDVWPGAVWCGQAGHGVAGKF